jgi:hypothetical protein
MSDGSRSGLPLQQYKDYADVSYNPRVYKVHRVKVGGWSEGEIGHIIFYDKYGKKILQAGDM